MLLKISNEISIVIVLHKELYPMSDSLWRKFLKKLHFSLDTCMPPWAMDKKKLKI